jgi:MFS family permease
VRNGLWRKPDFLKLWAGQAVSQIGSAISSVGLPLTAVLILNASPLQMGLLSGAGAAAILIFGLAAGAWVDRLRRRPILIFADLGRAAILGTVPLAAVLHRLTMGHLYLVAAGTGIFTVFFDVAYQAYVPSLVDRENILEGNSKLALTQSIADVAGPALTGLLVKLITAPMAILFDALSFLCSAFSISLIRKPEPGPHRATQAHILRDILEGLQASWHEPVLRALANRTAVGSFFLGFSGTLYFIFAIRDLGLTAPLLGVIISVGGVTNLLGALAAERLTRRFGVGPTLICAASLAAFSALLPPLARGPVAVSVAVLSLAQLFDMAWPVFNIAELTLRQSITPDHRLGRVNAAMHLLFRGVLPLGAFAGGAIGQIAGIRITMFAGGLGFLLSTLLLVFSPVRRLRKLPASAAKLE